MRLLLVIVSLWPHFVKAEWADWNQKHKTMFVISSIVITTDYLLTRDFASNRDQFPHLREANPIIGHHPHPNRVDLFLIANLILNYYITDMLPESHRGIYLTAKTIAHGAASINNYGLGLRIRF